MFKQNDVLESIIGVKYISVQRMIIIYLLSVRHRCRN